MAFAVQRRHAKLLPEKNRGIEYYMCGIAGFLYRSQRPDSDSLRRIAHDMAEQIRHRGPNAEGLWVAAEDGLGFGHRRLSIIDLSDAGAQPMASASGRYMITYNGEIYNFRELRKDLEAKDYAFRGHSDTEVLLGAIDVWGLEEALRRANGMFALALWDRREKSLSLARDRVGKKPLYYGWCGETFLFASELKAIRAHPDFYGDIDRGALQDLLSSGWIKAPRSIYRQIKKLAPGHILTLTADGGEEGQRLSAYWSARKAVEAAEANPFEGSFDEATDSLDNLLQDAVTQRMFADVDLGALLSGGVDSSLIVALMQKANSNRVRTFTIGFGESEYDEAPHAREVAAYLGTEHQEVTLTANDSLEAITDLPRIFDEPFADVSQLPTCLVSQIARRDVTVVLSGDGGDELFAGYKRYRECLDDWRRWGWIPAPLRAAAGAGMTGLGGMAWNRLGATAKSDEGRMASWRRAGSGLGRSGQLMAASSPRDLLARRLSHHGQPGNLVLDSHDGPAAGNNGAATEIEDPLLQMLYFDFTGYLPDDILVKVDRASMAVGLEARAPLLDHRVVEFAWRLPNSMRMDAQGGKRILKHVLARHLPPAITDRPKQGFSVPMADWLRGPLKDWAEDMLTEDRLKRQGFLAPDEIRRIWDQHRSGWRKHTKTLWATLVFQGWCEEYL